MPRKTNAQIAHGKMVPGVWYDAVSLGALAGDHDCVQRGQAIGRVLCKYGLATRRVVKGCGRYGKFEFCKVKDFGVWCE